MLSTMNNQPTKYAQPSRDLFNQLFWNAWESEGWNHHRAWSAVAVNSNNVRADIHSALSHLA